MTKSIGIIGGGIMGNGLARYFLAKGFHVNIVEADESLAEKSRVKLEKNFLAEVKKGKVTDGQASTFMANLHISSEMNTLKEMAIVIEAITEDLGLKQSSLSHLEKYLSSDTVICSNTSAIPITAISAALSAPERFIGTHFFNPANIMPLVEVVPGVRTSLGVVDKVCDFLSSVGKKPIRVRECPGFLVNRILGALINEAMWLLEDLAGIKELDSCSREIGLPMGLAALGDMVGWDVIYASNRTLELYYGKRFEVPPVLGDLYTKRRLGVKTGKGLYDHSTSPVEPTDDLVPVVRHLDSKALENVKLRLISAILAEGSRCLDENIAAPQDVDLSMTMGAGFPKGPLAWIDEIGLQASLDRLVKLNELYGSRFFPPPILRIQVLAGYQKLHYSRSSQ